MAEEKLDWHSLLTQHLKAELKPYGVYNKGINFTSSDTKVAAVSKSGSVTPKGEGVAYITVKAKENGKKAKCKVTVKAADETADTEEVLRPFVLTGYFAKDKINYVDIDEEAAAQKWNAQTKEFESVDVSEENILGNYTELIDTDADKDADLIRIVEYDIFGRRSV